MTHIFVRGYHVACGAPLEDGDNVAYWRDLDRNIHQACPYCIAKIRRVLVATQEDREESDDEFVKNIREFYETATDFRLLSNVYRDHPPNCGCSICFALRGPFEDFHER
jgi:hypothetical protein